MGTGLLDIFPEVDETFDKVWPPAAVKRFSNFCNPQFHFYRLLGVMGTLLQNSLWLWDSSLS